MGSGVSGEPLSPYFLVFIFQVKLSLENFLYSSSLTWSFFLGSQGKVLDHFHNKMNISDSPLWLCNENSHEQKVRKLGLGSSFLSFRVPSVGLQGPICRSFTILSFYSIFKNPIWAHNLWELSQDSLGETANTRTQATRTAVGSLFKKKKKVSGSASVSKAIDLLLWYSSISQWRESQTFGSEADRSAKVFFSSNEKF